jgi:hypothetical protein
MLEVRGQGGIPGVPGRVVVAMGKHQYTVYVDDNFHYMDESERYKLGEYRDCASAVAACKKLVDEYLQQGFTEKTTVEELQKSYSFFGEDPFIISDDPDCKFSARDYASRRIDEMCRRRP